MFCNRCGGANPDDVRFCVKCGAAIAPTKTQPPSTPAEYNLPGFSQTPAQPHQSYQNYPSGPPGAHAGASGRAIASMILSLVSIVSCGPFLSVPGLIMGKLELDAIRRGQSPLAGETFAKIGYYAGIAITALSCLAGLAYLLVVFFALGGRVVGQ